MKTTFPVASWTKKVLVCGFLAVSVACQQSTPEQERTNATSNDTTALFRDFISGLWSVDSQNFLNNEGYFIHPDGKLSLVASEAVGEWKLIGRDTLYMSIISWSPEPMEYFFIIDSLSPQYMILRDSIGSTVYRKVPFGTNSEGIVLNGFMGSLSRQIHTKEYRFDLPSARRIKVELQTSSPSVEFRIFDGSEELTAAPVKSWEGILVRSGEYRAVVSLDNTNAAELDGIEFNLKVLGY